MNKEFVPYELAVKLKRLGFDEECFSYMDTHCVQVNRPTFSQAFRWFREKYWYTALILCDSFQIVMQLSTSKTLDSKTWEWKPIYVTQTYHKEEGLKSYDESELACLTKLIEIVETRTK